MKMSEGKILPPRRPAKPDPERMRQFSKDFAAATKAYTLCPARVWSVFADLLPIDQKITRHKDHQECAYDFCELSTRDFTSVQQRHECSQESRERCQPLKGLFNGQTLNQAALAGKSTVWNLEGKNTFPLSQPFMAISHLWSDGTGTGTWPVGQVNECLFAFFRRIAYQFHCEGIWWDTLCIPQDRVARAIVIQTMDSYFQYARVTLVHDVFLREWLWDGAESACIAILLSPWFSRGWTALELARSRRVKVLFKGPEGPVIKDLDEDILSKIDKTTHFSHWAGSEIIQNLRKGISDLNGLVRVLRPRHTSWPKDMAVISGLLLGVDLEPVSEGGSILQQEIYKRVMAMIGWLHPGHLFHNTATIADEESWCPRTLLEMPIAETGNKLDVDQNLNVSGFWRCIHIQSPIMFKDRVVWNGVRQHTQSKLKQHLREADHCILLAEVSAIGQPIVLSKGLKRALLVKETRKKTEEPIYTYVGAVYFNPPLYEDDFRAARATCEYKSVTIEGLSQRQSVSDGQRRILTRAFKDIGGWNLLHQLVWTGNYRTPFEDKNINTQDKQGRQPLHLAAERGNQEIVGFVATQPSLAACSDFSGRTVLHYAAFGGSLPTIDVLLHKGFDPQVQDNDGNTPLHIAAEQGHKKIVQRLLNVTMEKKADVNWNDFKGLTPMHLAAYYGHGEVVECLIAAGADIQAAELRLGWTPLHFAALKGNSKIAESFLLVHGASGRVRDDKVCWTPFHCAAVSNNKALMRLFYEHGTEVNTMDVLGWTPLQLARALGHDISYLPLDVDVTTDPAKRKCSLLHHMAAYGPDAIRRILFNSANIHLEGLIKDIDVGSLLVQINANCRSILRFSVAENQQTVVQQLFEEGIDVNISYDDKRTPLHFAVESNVVGMAKFLIQKGADVTVIDTTGKTLLHHVAETGNVQMFNLLMEAGELNIEHKDYKGQTPLFTATYAVRLQIVQALLEAGANPNTRDINHRTPLYRLIQVRSWILFSDLLEHGAHPNICHEFASEQSELKISRSHLWMARLLRRRTDLEPRYDVDYLKPLLQAIQQERLSIFQELLERGADPNMKRGDMTPLMVAVEERDEAIVEALLNKGANPNEGVKSCTPVFLASNYKEHKIEQLLLAKGAKKTDSGKGFIAMPQPKLQYLSKRDLRNVSLLSVLIPPGWRGGDRDLQMFLGRLKEQHPWVR